MAIDLLWIFAFNLIVNSYLAFATFALLMWALMKLFRLRCGRFKVILCLLPLLKLMLDPFLYNFEGWALRLGIDPLQAESGTRILSAMVCYPTLSSALTLTLKEGFGFSVADMIALQLPFAVKGIVIVAFLGVILSVCIHLGRLRTSLYWIAAFRKTARPITREILDAQLKIRLEKMGCHLIESKQVTVPCAFGIVERTICLPSQLLKQFTQEEFEAVVAHEFEHLRWQDSFVRVVCHTIAALFWWIPLSKWLGKLEMEQESACDQGVLKQGFKASDLILALIKCAKRDASKAGFAVALVRKRSVMKRIFLITLLVQAESRALFCFKCVILLIFGFSFFSGKLWLF